MRAISILHVEEFREVQTNMKILLVYISELDTTTVNGCLLQIDILIALSVICVWTAISINSDYFVFLQNLQGLVLILLSPFVLPNIFPGNMTAGDILTFTGVD